MIKRELNKMPFFGFYPIEVIKNHSLEYNLLLIQIKNILIK